MKRLDKHSPRGVAATISGILLAAGSAPAFSQAADTSGTLEEVVVSARFHEEKLQQTPIAITAVTAEDIAVRGFTSAADIAYTVPNASFRPAQQAYGNTMTAYIRGIGQNDFNFAFEPGVGVYVDDVYYPTVMGTQFDLMDLERVEVLRGPQGTLFGRGSIGGAVRYVSKQPKGDDTGFIEGTYGSYNRLDLRAGYDLKLADNLFLRVTGVSKRANGYQDRIDFACAFPGQSGSLPAQSRNRNENCKVGTLGGTDVSGARAQLRFVANDALEFGLAIDYQNDNSEARPDTMTQIVPTNGSAWDNLMFSKYGVHYDARFLPPNPFVTYATFTDPYSGLSFPPKTALEQKGVSATATWRISDAVQSKTIVAYRKWDGTFATDQDGSPLGYSVVNGVQDFDYRTVEEQVSGTLLDQRLDWTAGVFYYRGNSSSAQSVELPAFMGARFALYASDPTGVTGGLPNSLLVNGRDIGRFENRSGFLHGVFKLTDAWRLTAGARYSSDKKHDLNDNSIVTQPVDSNQTHFDWLLGTDYQFTPDTMVYASASTGYRPPAYNPRPFQATQFIGVKGESMIAYEVGLKTDLFDRRLRLNLAGFYSDYKTRIVGAGGVECLKNTDGSVVPGGLANPEGGAPCLAIIPKTNYVNSPGKIKGGEAEITYRPVDDLMLTASAGYTSFAAEIAATGGITASGSPAYVPKWNGSASAAYTFHLPSGGTVSPRYDAFIQSQICTGAGVGSCSAGYALHNVRVEYATDSRNWTLAAGLANATDRVYYLNKFDLTLFGEATIEGQPGQPRTWFVTYKRSFN